MSIVQDYQALILDLSEVTAIGVSATLAIETIVLNAVNRDRQVWIVTTSAYSDVLTNCNYRNFLKYISQAIALKH